MEVADVQRPDLPAGTGPDRLLGTVAAPAAEAGAGTSQPSPLKTAEPMKPEDQPYLVGETLPRRMGVADMCRAFRIGRSAFHRQERAGKFERFELGRLFGHKAWSGTLIQRYLDCEPGASRFAFKRKSA